MDEVKAMVERLRGTPADRIAYGREAADLLEKVAAERDAWMDTAAQMSRNADFYRDLLDECAKHLGKAVYTADDGAVIDEPLRLKVPELVAALRAENYQLAAWQCQFLDGSGCNESAGEILGAIAAYEDWDKK